MAPYLDDTPAFNQAVDIVTAKSPIVAKSIKLNNAISTPPPVADDFMYDFKYNHALPTTDVLGVEIPVDCDAHKEASGIVAQLEASMSKGDAHAFTGIFLEQGKSHVLSTLQATHERSAESIP